MKAVQIDYVRKMIDAALSAIDNRTPDDIIKSFPGAVEDMVFETHYKTTVAERNLNKEKVELLLDVIRELG